MVVTLKNYKKDLKVRIRRNSCYYGQASGKIGKMDLSKVDRYGELTYIWVDFKGYSNAYRISGPDLDLEFVDFGQTIYELWT